jgi:hypothetical protein
MSDSCSGIGASGEAATAINARVGSHPFARLYAFARLGTSVRSSGYDCLFKASLRAKLSFHDGVLFQGQHPKSPLLSSLQFAAVAGASYCVSPR